MRSPRTSLPHLTAACDLFAGQRPVALSGIALPAGMRVAVTAPHPDDFDAIAVALRWLQARGATIEVAVLTSGISGVDDGFGGTVTAADKARLREAEQRASCARFGLEAACLTFLHLQEDARSHPQLNDANRGLLGAFLERVRPDLVFLPHGNDPNVAHQRTHTLVTEAMRRGGRSVVLCLNEDPKSLGVRPDLVMPFGDAEAAWKAQLLRLHASQQARNIRARGTGFDERILAMNRRAASALGLAVPFAEVFELACYDGARHRP